MSKEMQVQQLNGMAVVSATAKIINTKEVKVNTNQSPLSHITKSREADSVSAFFIPNTAYTLGPYFWNNPLITKATFPGLSAIRRIK